MTSLHKAYSILQELASLHVQDIILCPGGRNAPFVKLLSSENPFRVKTFFDERSAGFYALGLCQSQERPVAIITTSGTAVAEVLPAVIEAEYTQLPLIVISADRPRQLRGTGAPQTIDQISFLKDYVEQSFDIETPEEFAPGLLSKISLRQPVHINVCLDEPLLGGDFTGGFLKFSRAKTPAPIACDEDKDLLKINEVMSFSKYPLLLISSLKKNEISAVREFAQRWRGVVYAECTSGLREIDFPQMIRGGDKVLQRALQQNKIDGVVRVGGVPTARVWRDLESLKKIPVISVSSLPYPGLSQRELIHCEMSFLQKVQIPAHHSVHDEVIKLDCEKYHEIQKLLTQYPLSEPSWFQQISQHVRSEETVYIGNSLPIREWDLFASPQVSVPVIANRGANGIDGQMSSALAHTQSGKPLVIVIGDLTALYDMNAFWALPQDSVVRIFIINNHGGKIFERLFKIPLFYNEHQLDFSGLAQLWKVPYQKLTEPTQPLSFVAEKSILAEIVPDVEQTQSFWRDYDELWRS